MYKNNAINTHNLRIRIILLMILLVAIILIIRIIYLSSKNIEEYSILESGEFTFKRGNISDRNGRLLATSDELESLYANSKEIKSIDDSSKKISEVLNIQQYIIKNKLKENKEFIWIKRQITPQQAYTIKSLNLQGFKLKKEYKRFYPNKNLASHILGFCNIDGRGEEGIEKSMDSYLISDFNKQNYQLNEIEPEGYNISLTIDSNIQAVSEKIISESVVKFKSDFGSIILIDGISGEILSMANSPDFDPNSYQEYNQLNFRNNAIFQQFEPGSIFKIFSISALLDNNLIDTSNFYFCDGKYDKNGVTVKCTGHHGSLNYYGILRYSCNDAMLQAVENINDFDLYQYLKIFGFGTRTSISLPGEQPGILRDIENWTSRSMYSIPIGQEVSINALQLVRAATTFLNDGILIEPFIIKKIIDKNNNVLKSFERKEIRRVINKGVSNKVLLAMHSSTEPGGTIDDLVLEGVQFAAKSGTGQIYDINSKSYSNIDVTSSLLIIFPLDNPRYILYIAFNKPKVSVNWGGIIGAEAANNLLYYLKSYLNLSNENIYAIKNKNIIINSNYEKLKELPSKMPNLIGLTSGEILDIFSAVDVKFRIFGNGKVYKHVPGENEIITKKSIIEIYLK